MPRMYSGSSADRSACAAELFGAHSSRSFWPLVRLPIRTHHRIRNHDSDCHRQPLPSPPRAPARASDQAPARFRTRRRSSRRRVSPEVRMRPSWTRLRASCRAGLEACRDSASRCAAAAAAATDRAADERRLHSGMQAPRDRERRSGVSARRADGAHRGVVILEAVIDARGHVDRCACCADSAARSGRVEAVKGWMFTPALLNGLPVPVVMTVTVTLSSTLDDPRERRAMMSAPLITQTMRLPRAVAQHHSAASGAAPAPSRLCVVRSAEAHALGELLLGEA